MYKDKICPAEAEHQEISKDDTIDLSKREADNGRAPICPSV